MKNRQRGVTLMELLTVVTVLGILTSVSVPTYRDYVIRAQRTEAKSALMAQAGALERCFTRFNAYNDDDCPAFDELPRTLAEGRYRLQFDGTETAGTFTLEAVPLGGQAEDTDCQTLTLDQRGNRGVTDGATDTTARCWSR
jgi:type IV pilus assembly protein PilE